MWGQSELDGYVGYVDGSKLGPGLAPGRRVTALWSQVYDRPTARATVLQELPFLAEVAVGGSSGGFARLRGGGYVPSPHLAPVEGDYVAQAERFIGVPYLWGGRSARGIDCSALVQLALNACGLPCARDSDLQERELGTPLPSPDLRALRRGDLMFWKGHVAIVRNRESLIHANAHHMAVTIEPIATAVERIQASGFPLTSIRRL